MKLLRSSGVLYIPRQWENGIRVSPKPNSPEKREPRPLKKSWRYAVFLWITGPKSWVINENTFAFSRETKWYLGKSASSGKMCFNLCNQFSSVQSLSHVRLFVIPWTAACQAYVSVINSRSLLKVTSIELVMPSNHLILCHPLLLLPSVLPSIKVFSNKSALLIRWPNYWSFSFSINPSNEYSGLISLGLTGLISLLS